MQKGTCIFEVKIAYKVLSSPVSLMQTGLLTMTIARTSILLSTNIPLEGKIAGQARAILHIIPGRNME